MIALMHRVALSVVAALALLGCSVAPVELPLGANQRNEERREIELQPDRPFILLSFSGGGSRATALAAAVSARLDRITYPSAGTTRRLSQDVSVVSSVSGGSVFAAWVALYGLDYDKVKAFERKIGQFDGIGYLKSRALNPFTWVDLALGGRTRIDILEEMLSDLLERAPQWRRSIRRENRLSC